MGGGARPNFETGTIWCADNLDVMRGMNSETVDLIYLDPPFNSARNYRGRGKARKQCFMDIWSDRQLKEWDMLGGMNASIDLLRQEDWWASMELVKEKHSKSMYYYLCFMGVRLLQMKRILKPTGSIYLHCDPTSNSYLRLLLDFIFGHKNFVNEIVWCYKGRNLSKRNFERKTDTIYFYGKGKERYFDEKGAHRPNDMKHSGRYNKEDEKGRYALVKGAGGQYTKHYFKQTIMRENWWEIPYVKGKEYTGWATQKPLALLKRILLASSKKNDIVFDPFCGCATTLIAAATNERRFIGCDNDREVVEVARLRWRESADLFFESSDREVFESIHITTELPERNDQFILGEPPIDAKIDVLMLYGSTLYGNQLGHCNTCGKHLEYESLNVAHMVPIYQGGTNDVENLQLLCEKCIG